MITLHPPLVVLAVAGLPAIAFFTGTCSCSSSISTIHGGHVQLDGWD